MQYMGGYLCSVTGRDGELYVRLSVQHMGGYLCSVTGRDGELYVRLSVQYMGGIFVFCNWPGRRTVREVISAVHGGDICVL